MSSELVLDRAAQDILFREARSAHAYASEPIPEETIRAIYDLVKFAPTAFNMQPLRVVLVRSAEARERLVRHMLGSNQDETAAAPLVAILAADLEFHQQLPTQYPVYPQAKDVIFGDPAARALHAQLGANLQLGYFILGVRAAGLAAGPMAGFDPDGVNKEFFGDGRHLAICVVTIGRPTHESYHPRLPRLPYEQVFTSV